MNQPTPLIHTAHDSALYVLQAACRRLLDSANEWPLSSEFTLDVTWAHVEGLTSLTAHVLAFVETMEPRKKKRGAR